MNGERSEWTIGPVIPARVVLSCPEVGIIRYFEIANAIRHTTIEIKFDSVEELQAWIEENAA